MDIQQSLLLELCVDYKLTKPCVRVNLVGPQVSLPYGGSQLAGGVFIFLCVIRRHFLACKDIAGGSELSAAITFFSQNTKTLLVGPSSQVDESLFCT